MKTVTIGGASGMWGDSAIATPQLLSVSSLDYLVYDYLAETTLSIMARARAHDPGAGYAADFVSSVLEAHLETIAARGIRVVANAGGLNPIGCRAAIERLAAARGLRVTVAAVTGDDVMALAPELSAGGARDLDGQPIPARLVSANAYLGARAIVEALKHGAQIVVTGRTVDSALVLGPLVHEFGWAWDDYDRLARGTLAGHVIECGAQGTGGLFTDWERVHGWDNIGYPVIECSPDGGFVVTKPADTGGLVVPAAVGEQVVYEIGDPSCYAMADVTADLRHVTLEQVGEQRVRVSGARGRPPSSQLKVSATFRDGYQLDALMAIRGIRAPEKARRTAEALLSRTRQQMTAAGFADYSDHRVELLGCESLYGPHARVRDTREVVLRIAVRHRERAALEFLRREAPSAGVSMGPGTRGHFGGRAEIRPVVRLCSFLIDKTAVSPKVHIGERTFAVVESEPAAERAPAIEGVHAVEPGAMSEGGHADTSLQEGLSGTQGPTVRSRLVDLAWARSGDKGDSSNIGVIARRPEIFGVLRRQLTADAVAKHFAHLLNDGRVDRYELPGLGALNFMLHGALGGGGMASLRSDPLGKSYAQILLDMELDVPQWIHDVYERPVRE